MVNVREVETSELLGLIRRGEATTRAELQDRLQLSRVTLGKRLDTLLRAGLVDEAGQDASTGGRPRTVFRVRPGCGVLLAVDIGSSRTNLAVTDFAGTILVRDCRKLDPSGGPGAVLPWIRRRLVTMLREVDAADGVLGAGICVPAPVDPASGRLSHPPLMPGWHGVDIAAELSEDLGGVPVAVGSDAQVTALGEFRTHWSGLDGVVLVKAGEGIAAAAVIDGVVRTGATGAAGELGHMRIPEGRQCRCGRFGCLESVAGGWALRERLSEAGWTVGSSEELSGLALRGDSLSIELLEDSARLVGRALAPVVAVLNPSAVVVAGALADGGAVFLDPLRAALQAVGPQETTRPLTVVSALLGADAGVVGAALLVQDLLTSPAHLDRLMARVASEHTDGSFVKLFT
ncbi:ROK family transcriptional regulator [Actinomyces sp.]|uniref:ROK family transcriptional regulator n=1 Tax=Actinomyces sp. TaxID=29317 RepID=UPI0026DCF46D|nr:ROK family transcriptional regulator [Actinomyces sp.]MDO4900779.1 ROK family transcriptional regulator [Actinomyces sp.]